MSSDSGLRKRNKDKKKKKGSAGDVNVAVGAPLREVPMKLVIDETIHVQKDVSFGGNWCTKLIFLSFFVVLAGLIFFALSNISFSRAEQDETESTSWFASLLNFDLFSGNETPKEVIDEEPPVDSEPQSGYLDILWQLYPFGGNEEPPPVAPEDAEELEASKELENDHDSPEEDNQDEDNYLDEENDHEKDDEDEKYRSSSNDDDNDGDRLEDNDDNSSSEEDFEDTREQHNQYSYNNYYRDEKDSKEESEESQDINENDNDSPDVSEEQLDRRDNRYNYYHRRDESIEQEKYIRDDDLNDSSELGGHERLDSDENKDDEASTLDDDEKKSEDDSHSSEEVEHDSPTLEEPQSTPEPKTEENEIEQSGNMITKLSVGASLIFVAYSVIIRKWNNYVNRVPDDAEDLLRNAANEQNDENSDNIAQSMFENVMDLVNDDIDRFKDQMEKNKTLQEYLETPSQSESEYSEDNSANRVPQDRLPIELDDSETDSETEDETDNSEAGQNSTSNYGYDRANITNQYDWRHREELDDADDDVDRGRISLAMEKYEKISKIEPRSVRAKYGIAKCFDKRAELQKSNKLLAKVIQIYMDALQMPNVPDAIFKLMAERVINRMRFKGDYIGSISIQNLLIERFPEKVSYQNDLVVSYLILNRISEAKVFLEKILQRWSNNGLALVNYGFVLKMRGKLEKAVEFLYKGIETNDDGTQDSRFYFHLGDALQKLHRNGEAMKLYEAGAKKGIFLSKYQRSLYNVNRLTARPWWSIEETKYEGFFKNLISNWKKIRDEATKILKTAFQEESEQLREIGDWRQFEIYSRGEQKPECKKVPVTCRIIDDFPPAAGCRRGQIKFSLMEPGTHVWPHCGPTNCRLRAHLGLIVPDNVTIRVAEEIRSWKEGEILIFDDSFEHEIWHNGTSPRLILIVDVWHPELTSQERRALTAI